jgi:hypothetical protein
LTAAALVFAGRRAYGVGMWRFDLARDGGLAGVWYRRVQRSPGWVNRAAMAAAVLTIVVPLLALALAAAAVGVLVFVVLGAVAWMATWLGGAVRPPAGGPPVPGNDGRVNVRVVRRD